MAFYRLAIAEDNIYWRNVLVELIHAKLPDAEIAIEAVDGKQLIEFLANVGTDQGADLALLDLKMNNVDGFETARWLHQHRPKIKIITLSFTQDEKTVLRLLKYGVLGFLHKNIDGDELIAGIETVKNGDTFFSSFPDQRSGNMRPTLDSVFKFGEVLSIWNSLSAQEQQLFRLVCTEMSYAEIAKGMRLAVPSVQQLAGEIFERFRVQGRIALYLLAYKYKLI